MRGKRSPVDSHVGGRIRLRRVLLGISQEKLGNMVGLTFQQIQKYEKGLNRVGASRLYQLSQVLEVPPSFFFDGMDASPGEEEGGSPSGMLSETPMEPYGDDPMSSRETLELVRAYYRIPDLSIRRRLLDLIRSVGTGRGTTDSGMEESPPGIACGVAMRGLHSGTSLADGAIPAAGGRETPGKQKER